MESPRQLIRYLTIEDILKVAIDYVDDYQVLKENQLHYLVEAVGGKFGDIEFYPTIFQKAAVYAHHIITGHIFLDGNKRIGMHCMLLFLNINGYFLLLDLDDSIIDLGFKIADGTITNITVIADRIQSWVV